MNRSAPDHWNFTECQSFALFAAETCISWMLAISNAWERNIAPFSIFSAYFANV